MGAGRDLWWCVPLALLPFACYVGLMGLFAPQAFLFDLQYTFFRLQKLSLGQQLSTLYLNYSTLFLQDYWMAPATIGLLMLRPLRLQRLTLLLFLLPITILGRTVALFSLSFYYMIPLLPFVALGMALFVGRAIPYLAQAMLDLLLKARQRAAGSGARTLWTIDASPATASRIMPLILALIIAIPFGNSLTQTIQQIEHGFSTPIDPFLLNATDAHQTAAFINRQVAPHDLIIASPTIAWLFQANSADFQMSTAFTGQETVHLPANIPPNRFAFDAHYTQARFVVIDNLWHNWAIWHVAGVSDMMHNVQKWHLLFQAGEIKVYRNPSWADCD